MSEIQQAPLGSVKFLRTELATARAFLDLAETSSGEAVLRRNLRNAELAMTVINQALDAGEIDPVQADEIRTAARTITRHLASLVTG